MKSNSRLTAGCFQSIVDNDRRHGLVLDLPEAKGGNDFAPTALELVVMGLAGCISTIWAVVAKNSRLSYRNIEVVVDAEMPDGAPTITGAKAVVTVDSDEPEEKLQRVLEKTMQVCPVGRLYEKAGIEIGTQLIRAQELAASAN